MKQVYEVHYTMNILVCFSPMLLFPWYIIVSKILRKTTDVNEEQYKLVSRIVLGFVCILQLIIIIDLLSDHFFIYSAYHNNNYLTVEGTVENFEGDVSKESFEVSGVKFYYDYNGRAMWTYDGLGYAMLRERGGVITGNGQKVRIGYVKHQFKNVIVAIWTDG